MNVTDKKYSEYDRLFINHYPGLCIYSENLVMNSLVAEDLVQDVFVNIWMKRKELTFDSSLGPYLYRSVHNACIQYLRHQQRTGDYKEQVNTKLMEAELIPVAWMHLSFDPAEKEEIYNLYRETLSKLPEKTRTIFILSREHGLKNSEISEQTGLSVKSVEYHISKALSLFRITFKDYVYLLLLLAINSHK